MKNLEATDTEFFAKSYEKCKILSEFLETKIIILDDYACPKVQFLIIKEEYDWRCSNYPFRHAKVSERVFSKPIKRGASRSSERRRSKISKKNFRTNTKKNSSIQKKNYFKFN